MFGRATITLGIGPYSSYFIVYSLHCLTAESYNLLLLCVNQWQCQQSGVATFCSLTQTSLTSKRTATCAYTAMRFIHGSVHSAQLPSSVLDSQPCDAPSHLLTRSLLRNPDARQERSLRQHTLTSYKPSCDILHTHMTSFISVSRIPSEAPTCVTMVCAARGK